MYVYAYVVCVCSCGCVCVCVCVWVCVCVIFCVSVCVCVWSVCVTIDVYIYIYIYIYNNEIVGVAAVCGLQAAINLRIHHYICSLSIRIARNSARQVRAPAIPNLCLLQLQQKQLQQRA